MVCRRLSEQAMSLQGQNSSSWVYSGGTRSKNRRKALLHLDRLHKPDLVEGLMHVDTYSVRSFWHTSSTLQALAASRQRFTVVIPSSESVENSNVSQTQSWLKWSDLFCLVRECSWDPVGLSLIVWQNLLFIQFSVQLLDLSQVMRHTDKETHRMMAYIATTV